MSLRTKFLWIGLAGIVVLFTSLEILGGRLVMDGFGEVEQRDARRGLDVAVDALLGAGEPIQRAAVDWGIWDDLVDFVEGDAPNWEESNISVETLLNLGCNRMVIFDERGQLFRAYLALPGAESVGSVEPSYLGSLRRLPQLWQARVPGKTIHTIAEVDGRLELLAAGPIMHTDRSGSAHGTILVARQIDTELLDRLQRRLRLDFTLLPCRGMGERAGPQSQVRAEHAIELLAEGELLATRTLRDIRGEPVAQLQVRFERPIHKRAEQTLALLRSLVLGSLIASIAVMVVCLRHLVVLPVARLSEQAKAVRDDPDSAPRISPEGSGEIAELAATVRQMQDALAERNEDLIGAIAAARDASEAKSKFLANMSHEIRTPLNAIIGFAELMGAPDVSPEEMGAWAHLIHQNGHTLHDLIGDILDLTKIESGRIELERRPFDLAALISELGVTYGNKAEMQGLDFVCEVPEGRSSWVVGDAARVRQVLVNLVGNALKFTSEGRVALRARIVGSGTSRCYEIDVEDSGPGIAESKREAIFDVFVQEDSSTTRKFGGSGLGLAISRSLVELMAGTLHVESTVGVGSCFRLSLPAGLEASARPSEAADQLPELGAHPLEGRRVLIAEDGADNALLARRILERAGATVDWVVNGKLAVEACEAGELPYDLILMDMQMPVLSGYDATRVLRESGAELPILALTANAMVGDRERCLEAGCSDYLKKPLRAKLLVARCAQWIEGAFSRDSSG